MAEIVTPEQSRALAIAQARRRRAEAEGVSAVVSAPEYEAPHTGYGEQVRRAFEDQPVPLMQPSQTARAVPRGMEIGPVSGVLGFFPGDVESLTYAGLRAAGVPAPAESYFPTTERVGNYFFGPPADEKEEAARNLFSMAGPAGVIKAVGATVRGVGQGVNWLRNIPARYVDQQYIPRANRLPPNMQGPPLPSQTARESARLEREIGQQYTPGQATGSRGMLTIEGMVRRHPASADRMAEYDTEQLNTSLTYLNRVMDDISQSNASLASVGDRVARAFDRVVTHAQRIRRSAADTDFPAVDRLSGNYRVIPPQNVVQEIDSLIRQFSVPGGGDASATLVNRLRTMRGELIEEGRNGVPRALTAQEANRLLQIYGDASRGTGALFRDLDTGQQRMIAGRLVAAAERDLDVAIETGGMDNRAAQALRTARDNYRINSQAINQFEQSVLGRLFGGTYERAPERIAAVVGNMTPTELRQSFGILERADPEIAQTVKRMLIEKATTYAGRPVSAAVPAAEVAGQPMFSAAKFLTKIRESQVWDIMNPRERMEMTNSVRDLERIAFRAGTDGSPTAPHLFAFELVKAFGGGVLALSPTQIAKTAASVLVPNRVVSLITTPEGRQALRTIRTTPPDSRQSRDARNMVLGILTTTAQKTVDEGERKRDDKPE